VTTVEVRMKTLTIFRSVLFAACAVLIALSVALPMVTQAKATSGTGDPGTTLSPTPASTPIKWPADTALTINPSISFAWLREDANSAGAYVATVMPGVTLAATAVTARWDGLEWWDYVFAPGVFEPGIIGYWGWIEQDSLQISDTPLPTMPPLPTEPPVNWPDGTLLSIKSGIPFVWLRGQASSSAAVEATVYPGSSLDATLEDARWDGMQWWGYVHTPGTVGYWGWVEQGSLQIAGPPTPLLPVPTLAPTTPSCVASYHGQVSIAFLNYRPSMIWINGLDANCHEFHMWSIVGNAAKDGYHPLMLPAGMLIVRIRDYTSNQLLAQYTITASMNDTSIAIH